VRFGLLLLTAATLLASPPQLLRVPASGVQPEARVDAQGVTHMIYLAGNPAASDVFYVTRAAGAPDFSKPLRVNSVPGSAIALGTVRGAHIALGRNGIVHVTWNASGPNGKMQYARLKAKSGAFEPQLAVVTKTTGLDGGGTIASDQQGNVFVAWHAKGESAGEEHRRVYLARSTDDGATFAPEFAISDEEAGACGCCGMAGFASQGKVQFLYRSAGANVHRDIHLLTSSDHGTTFQDSVVQTWDLTACPMSTEGFTRGESGVLMTWENQNQVYFSPAQASAKPTAIPGDPKNRKHPSIAQAKGRTLVVWTEGTSYRKGGRLAWQEFDAQGNALADHGTADGVPVNSDVTALASPDGQFGVVY
jgi:hypothetical protein